MGGGGDGERMEVVVASVPVVCMPHSYAMPMTWYTHARRRGSPKKGDKDRNLTTFLSKSTF